MTTYRILSMGGRLLAQTDDGLMARRIARHIADERGCYVELHHIGADPWIDYVYPQAVAS